MVGTLGTAHATEARAHPDILFLLYQEEYCQEYSIQSSLTSLILVAHEFETESRLGRDLEDQASTIMKLCPGINEVIFTPYADFVSRVFRREGQFPSQDQSPDYRFWLAPDESGSCFPSAFETTACSITPDWIETITI